MPTKCVRACASCPQSILPYGPGAAHATGTGVPASDHRATVKLRLEQLA
jgi:hypothetical protein